MTATAHHSTLATLWQRVRHVFNRLTSTFGAPAAIAVLSFSSVQARRAIVRQLTRVEIYVRKLLLAEAALLAPMRQRGPRLVELPLPSNGLYAPVTPSTRQHTPTRRQAAAFAHPEAWTVAFSLALPRDTRSVPETSAPRVRALWGAATPPLEALPQTQPRRLRPDAFRIARRIEALRRVLNDPAPHARRLSRAGRALSIRSPGALTRYAFTTPRRLAVDHHDPNLDVDIHCAGWIAHDSIGDTS